MAPLHLFEAGERTHDRWVLRGVDLAEYVKVTLTHSVHQHAVQGLLAEIMRYPLRWVHTQSRKLAQADLTPDWVHIVVEEAIVSIVTSGYYAYRIRRERVEIAPVGTLDIKYTNAVWSIANSKRAGWQLVIVSAPRRGPQGGVTLNSCAFNAAEDTAIYDEMYANVRKRDHFNSTPSCFTTVDRQLKNQGGSTKQWFQQATASDAAANRAMTVSLDSNFQTLVQNRASSIKRLGDQSAIARERLNKRTRLAGTTEDLQDQNHMLHSEHIVSDGREMHSTRSLMSLTDGYQASTNAMYNIFFHFKVPPQIFGKNVNSERTGVNPRLNEIVLTTFFAHTNRLRVLIGLAFKDLVVADAHIEFLPALSTYELELLQTKLKSSKLVELHALAYNVPASFFDAARLREIPVAPIKPPGGQAKPELAAKKAQATDGH